MMLAITLWRPWPDAMLYGGKPLENRSWAPWWSVVGKQIALHAGAKYDRDGATWMRSQYLYDPPSDTSSPKGIVGVATVTGYVTESDDPWFFGPYGWKLEDRIALPKPIQCRGAQGLWKVPEEIEQKIISSLRGGGGTLPRVPAASFQRTGQQQ